MKGAFLAAPLGGLLWGFAAMAIRLTSHFVLAKTHRRRFDALDPPPQSSSSSSAPHFSSHNRHRRDVEDNDDLARGPFPAGVVTTSTSIKPKGRFF